MTTIHELLLDIERELVAERDRSECPSAHVRNALASVEAAIAMTLEDANA